MEINAIYEGDNLEVMSKFDSKSIDLIYADPPFFTNKQFEIIWHDGAEKRAFEDRWKGGIEHYKTWMEPRLEACHRLLKDTGSFFLHCDYHASARLRVLLDRIFDIENFRKKSSGRGKLDAEKHNTRATNLESAQTTFSFMQSQKARSSTLSLYLLQKHQKATSDMLKSSIDLQMRKVENTELLIYQVHHLDPI